ncbi:hypothetical protein [Actinomadura rugatobispora]|uniref:Uncharacterized protein n=1 Tax=Actinomadura rugatobispora TaxID=1994 RepID=A0ABW0ZVJ9_9ACTN|nr:hypothetical protein GCM10010200_109910 [Actinomadura rugatobispora]
MIPPQPGRRLSSRAVQVGMVSVLSLVVAGCSSDTTPSASGLATPSSPATPTTPEPTASPSDDDDDDDDEVTAYCVRSPKGGVPDEEPDQGYRVVDDDLCDDDDLGSDSTPPSAGSPGASSSRYSYFWYYGGRHRSGYVSGGELTAPASGTITTRSGTTARAGFGSGSRSGG